MGLSSRALCNDQLGGHVFRSGFAIEALLLVWTGVIRNRLSFHSYRDWIGRTGVGLVLFALVVQPLIGPLVGRDWKQAEIFGVTPDPTVLATLGILLTVNKRPPWGLMIIPLIWCILSGATLWTMGSPGAPGRPSRSRRPDPAAGSGSSPPGQARPSGWSPRYAGTSSAAWNRAPEAPSDSPPVSQAAAADPCPAQHQQQRRGQQEPEQRVRREAGGQHEPVLSGRQQPQQG